MPGRFDEIIGNIRELYTALNGDGHHQNREYRNMLNTLNYFLTNSAHAPADQEAYGRLVDSVLHSVNGYISRNNGNHIRHFHQDRVTAAGTISKNLNELLGMVAEPEEAKKSTRAELDKLAALHAASSSKIVRPEPKYRENPSLASRAWNGFKHGFMYIYRGISTALDQVFAAPFRVANVVADTTNIQNEKNFRRIPGLASGEEFQINDAERFGDKIIDDVRRAPMVWEQEVPEDPNQEPTMTIESEQASEGSIRSINRLGTSDVGHAFITLRYTKKNPITGKDARYKLTFGFHPKGVANIGGTQANMLVNESVRGGIAPGELQNDANAVSHAARTWTVTNRQINKVLLEAEGFAKGGYNMISRNCTTFVKTMADVAGLDTEGLFQEVDFNIGAVGKAGVGVGSLFGSTFKADGKRRLRKLGGQADEESYQLIGQDSVSMEDISHLKGTFNHRMKGYQPSRLAEMIKQQKDFVLGATNYAGEDQRADPTKPIDSNAFAERLLIERQTLAGAIGKFYEAHKMEGFEQLHDSLINITQDDHDQLVEASSVLDGNNDELTFAQNRAEQWQKVRKAVLVLDHYEKTLNEMYQSTFNKNPELMIPFQHMVSVLETSRRDLYARLMSLDGDIPKLTNQGRIKEEDIEVDESREASGALRELILGHEVLQQVRGGARETVSFNVVAAGAIVFGNKEKFSNALFELRELQNQERQGVRTSDGKKEQDLLLRKMQQVLALGKALNYYAGADRFTQGETDLLFRDMPMQHPGNTEIPFAFQAFAWEHVMAPAKEEMKNSFRGAMDPLVNDFGQGKLQIPDIVTDMIGKLPASLVRNRNELEQINKAVVSRYERQNPYDPNGNMKIEDYVKQIQMKAVMEIIDSFTESYLKPMKDEAIRSVLKEEASNNKRISQDNLVSLLTTANNHIDRLMILTRMEIAHKINPDSYPAPKDEDYKGCLRGDLQNQPKEVDRLKAKVWELTGKITLLLEPMEESLKQTLSMKDIFAYLEGETKLVPAGENAGISQKAKDGAKLVEQEQRKAVMQLRSFAVSRKQVISKTEKKQEFEAMAKLAFVRSLDKLSEKKRIKILEEIAAKPKKFDKYVESLSNDSDFLKKMQKAGGVSLNTLKDKAGFENLMKTFDRVLGPSKRKNIEKAPGKTLGTVTGDNPQLS